MKTLDDIKDLLSKQEITDLQEIVNRIKRTEGGVRMIILFGSHARGEQINSPYPKDKKSDYDILIIPFLKGNKICKTIGAELLKSFEDIDKTVQVTVDSIKEINTQLKEGQYFFSDIIKDGIYLHKVGDVELIERVDISKKRALEISENYFETWFQQAADFLDIANYCITKENLKLAAFNLQQCVESCYKCVDLTITHYTPKEHLLIKLRGRAVAVASDKRLKIPFPINTLALHKDYKHLDYAYIGSRYDMKYSVTIEQLKYWQQETEKLRQITKQVCQEYMSKLKNDFV